MTRRRNRKIGQSDYRIAGRGLVRDILEQEAAFVVGRDWITLSPAHRADPVFWGGVLAHVKALGVYPPENATQVQVRLCIEKTEHKWAVPLWPGAFAKHVSLQLGDDLGGDVAIQDYGESFRVSSFLPGRCVTLEGDTPKVEPEISKWFTSIGCAERELKLAVDDAKSYGWR